MLLMKYYPGGSRIGADDCQTVSDGVEQLSGNRLLIPVYIQGQIGQCLLVLKAKTLIQLNGGMIVAPNANPGMISAAVF